MVTNKNAFPEQSGMRMCTSFSTHSVTNTKQTHNSGHYEFYFIKPLIKIILINSKGLYDRMNHQVKFFYLKTIHNNR
jgi:hypothetical protein